MYQKQNVTKLHSFNQTNVLNGAKLFTKFNKVVNMFDAHNDIYHKLPIPKYKPSSRLPVCSDMSLHIIQSLLHTWWNFCDQVCIIMKVAKQLNKDSQSCLFVSSSVTTESRELESSTITSRQFVVVGNVTAISGLTSASNTNFISVLGNRSWHLTEQTQCKQIRANFTEIRCEL